MGRSFWQEVVGKIASLISVVVLLLTPIFNLVYLSVHSTVLEAPQFIGINGFLLIGAASFTDGIVGFSMSTWIVFQWIFFIGAILTAIVSIMLMDYTARAHTIIKIVAIIYSTYYLIAGCVVTASMNETLKGEYYWQDYNKYYRYATAAFWPLIIQVVCAIVNTMCRDYLLTTQEKLYIMKKYGQTNNALSPKSNGTVLAVNPATPVVANVANNMSPAKVSEKMSEIQKMELLLKWKELLDKGVVTQEEFDNKKARLLF